MELRTRVWLGAIIYFLFIPSCSVYAQTKLNGSIGLSSSVNMGEIGPAPVFKNTLTVGDRFRFENDLEFSTMDKYTKAGWSVADGIDVLIFPSWGSGFFLSGGADYRHRNGGTWAKDGIRVGGGAGYEKANSQLRFSVKKKVMSLNDNIDYAPYFELLARRDYSLRSSNWSLRTEGKMGFFKYVQNNIKSTAFYSDAILGLAYRWP